MIEVSVLSTLAFALVVALASLAGLSLARCLPWSVEAKQAGVPLAIGVGAGPLLAGLAVVVALGALPGAAASMHIALVLGLLLATALAGRALGGTAALGKALVLGRPAGEVRASAAPRLLAIALGLLVAVWAATLAAEALLIPLIQNDSLEYALVGRLLLEERALDAYPALDPSRSESGFYGPWTHPPLYPALIYLTFALQGSGEEPGLMRLLSPWAFACAAALTFALARRVGLLAALLATLVFATTPLLFLGAGSGLLDAFVVLALALVLAIVTSLHPPQDGRGAARAGAALGLAIGLGLWTHSQAILLLPLALAALVAARGTARPGLLAIEAATAIATAASVAVWPYLRNLEIYGSPISDNPIVFALPSLAWDDYFRLARGIDTWANRIQYGIFKGWFALEAYAFAFWFATVGVVLYVGRLLRAPTRGALLRGRFDAAPDPWLLALLAALACYLGGVVVSTLAGIDLMIRNERYMLMIMTPIAVFAGVGLAAMIEGLAWLPRLPRRALGAFTAVCAVAMFATMVPVVGFFRWGTLGLGPDDALVPMEEKLARWQAYAPVAFLAAQAPSDALVLSFKPADMYYAHRRMMSYLDPAMLPFYEARTAEEAQAALAEAGVRWIHVPGYFLPPVYNSHAMTLLADPGATRLIVDDGYNQLYEVLDGNDSRAAFTPSRSDLIAAWHAARQVTFGGRKTLIRGEAPGNDANARNDDAPTLFQRDTVNAWISHPSASMNFPGGAGDIALNGAEALVSLKIEGDGFVQVRAFQYDARGDRLLSGSELILMETTVVGGSRTVLRRFNPHGDARWLRLAVETRGVQTIRIASAIVTHALPES